MVEFTLYSVTARLHIAVTLAAEFSFSGTHIVHATLFDKNRII